MKEIKVSYVEETEWEKIKKDLLTKEETIYVSESPRILKELKERNLPIVVLFTEENSKEDLAFARFGVYQMEDIDLDFAEKIYQRHLGLPMEIRKEKRIIIRELSMSDVEKIYGLYSEKSASWLEAFFTNREELEVYLKDYIENIYDFYGYGLWAICLSETGEFIGMGGFSSREDGLTLELGFAILECYQGKGYAIEACQIMIEYARQEIPHNYIIAKTDERNEKAKRVLEKLGFRKEENMWWF